MPRYAATAVLSLWASSCMFGAIAGEGADDAPPPQDETIPVLVAPQTITVTVDRLPALADLSSYAYHHHELEALEQGIGTTALDRLHLSPGVFLQRTAANQASPYVRGLTGEQTLLMLDGVRLSHAAMRPGPNQYSALIPASSLAGIDVILGPSSAVTGSDGLTGAVNFLLAEAGRAVDQRASPWLRTRIDYADGMQLATGVDGRDGAWAYSAEIDLRRFHDRQGGRDTADRLAGAVDGDRTIPNTAYDQASMGVRVAWTAHERHRLALRYGQTAQFDAKRPDGYAANSGRSERLARFFDPQRFSYLHLSHDWQPEAMPVEQVTTILWHHRFREQQVREDLTGDRYRRRVTDDGIDVLGVQTEALSIIDEHRFSYGLSFSGEQTTNDYREYRTLDPGDHDPAAAVPYNSDQWENRTTLPDGARYRNLGLFLRYRLTFAERGALSVGLRWNRSDWDIADGMTGDTAAWTGDVRGLWHVNDQHDVFVSVGRTFRAPNLTNLAGTVDRGSSGEEISGAADLDSEYGYGIEAGWRHQRDDGSRLALTLWGSRLEDLIQQTGTAPDLTWGNSEGARLWGAEVDIDQRLELGPQSHLALIASASLVRARIDMPQADGSVEREHLSRANRLFGIIGLRYQPAPGYWVQPQMRWHASYDRPAPGDAGDVRMTMVGNADGSMPGYALFDLVAGWTAPDDRQSLTVQVENLGDRSYRSPGSAIDGPGLNLGLSWYVRW